jgi:paired amphipathic helix protein Sin3a
MRELRVEDALLYLDQVKVEFGDRPHIYNEFLDIMKTFKTQQIDTPGVIRRVSNLFQGNRKLVLGFNTFLPEGYKIELPPDGEGPPVAVYRAPGSNVAHVLRESAESQAVSVTAAAAALDPSRGGNEAAPIQRVDPRGITGPPPPRPQPQLGRAILPMDAGGVVARGPMGVPLEVARQPPQPAPRHMPGGVAPRQPAPRGLSGPLQGDQPTGIQPQQAFPLQHHQPLPPTQQQQPQQQQPLEFDHAINYVTTIKRRFASEPETYKKFLEILHTYQKEQRGIKEVLDEVSELFEDHPDLLKEFTYFLPDAVQAQAKAQLDVAAKAAEQRKRNKAKAAIMSTAQGMRSRQQQQTPASRAESAPVGSPFVPGLQQQRSTMEREANLTRMAQFGVVSFSPMQPPRKNEMSAAQAAVKVGRPAHIPALPNQPRTAEAVFFEKVKVHLQRRELAADKPTGSRRHTPHVEFLKCLHLYGAGILNKDELLLLLKGLFMQGHAPKSGAYASGASQNPEVAADAQSLLREFEELMIHRGPYANQESALKDRSSYGALRVRDFDFTNCDRPTPSYCLFPDDYPDLIFLSHPGQSEDDASVLNKELVCMDSNIHEYFERDVPRKRSRETRKRLAPGIEESDGARKRHNCYEDVLFRIEDERFEMDMAIERNVHALRRIESMAKEVQTLREQEEKDGQPIGRLRYQLKRNSLNSTHINAIGRVYGERGDEILQHLLRHPYIVLPVVYQRLKQKEGEWRKAKSELIEVWNTLCEYNYEGSLDVQCYFNRKALEKLFARSKLIHQCQHARSFTKHPEKNTDEAATRPFSPVFGKSVPDIGAVFYQPYMELDCKIDDSHKYSIHLIAHMIKTSPSVSCFNRERIGRIWAEFMVPWFRYPSHWVIDEVRESFSGKLGPSVTKCTSSNFYHNFFNNVNLHRLSGSCFGSKSNDNLWRGINCIFYGR